MAPAAMPRRISLRPSRSIASGEDVLHDLADERVVGDLDVADDGLEAGCGLGEDVGEEVVGAGALDLRGDALALLHAEELEASGRRPSASGS